MYQIMESIFPMCYEDRHVLQQYGGFDEDNSRIIDYSLDHRKLVSVFVRIMLFDLDEEILAYLHKLCAGHLQTFSQ